ncbi:MAG: tetratricopeptide repeat protein [Gammaproteobacteria bacterium]|nr:tetratricopeptide repeat protein [Gammaproteobacteria bacterium]
MPVILRARCRRGRLVAVRWRIFLLAVLVGLGVTGCGGDTPPAKSDREFIAEATRLLEGGRLHDTVNELKAALLVNPRNTEARWMLGQTYLTLGEGAGAEKELRSAADLGLEWSEVVVLVARARLLQWDMEGALEVLDSHPVARGALLGQIAAARGDILWRMNEPADAARAYQEALRASPPPIEAFVGDARLRYFNADLDVADRRLEDAAVINDSDDQLACTRGQLATHRLEMAKAREQFQQVLRRSPEYALVRRCAYRNLLALGLRAPGEGGDNDAIRAGLRKEFKDTRTIEFLESVDALFEGRLEVAQNGLESFLQKVGDAPAGSYFLALTYSRQGQWQQALDPVRMYRSRNPDDVLGQRLDAIVQAGVGRFDDAAESLVKRLWFAPEDIDTLALLGALALHQPDADLREDPFVSQVLDSLAAEFPIAPYALPSGDRSLAVVGFWPWLAASAELSEAEVEQVRGFMRLRMHRELDRFLEQLEATQAERPSTWLLKTLAALSRGDDLVALRAAQNALALAPDDARVAYYAAYAADVTSGGYGLADRVGELVAAHPDDLPAQVLAVAAALRDKSFGVAETALARVMSTRASPALRALAVRLALANGDSMTALGLLEGLRADQPDVIEWKLLGATLKAGVQDWVAVREALAGLPATYLQRASVRRLTAAAALGLGEPALAVREFEALLSARPGDPHLLEAAARAQLAAGRGREALVLARRLQRVQTGDVSGFRLEGDVLSAMHEYRDAAFAYQSAFNLAPDRELAVALSGVRVALGDSGGALAVLEEWVGDHPEDFAMRVRQADILWHAGRRDAAREILQEILAGNSDQASRADAETLLKSWREAEAADVGSEPDAGVESADSPRETSDGSADDPAVGATQ